MANKIGKYNPFKEWLLWCGKKSKTVATTLASYLRRFEEDLLLKGSSQCLSFSEIHQLLKDIDDGKQHPQQIGNVINELQKIHKTLTTEIKAVIKGETKDQMSEVDLETLYGWQRAFNAYLRFLVDVTDCFDMSMVRSINPKIGVGGMKAKPDKYYPKRVKLFRCGLYKLLLEKLNFKLIDKTLDAFAESVDILLGSGGSYNVVATEMIIGNEGYDGFEEFDDLFNWRSMLLDGITMVGNIEERKISRRPPYKIISHKSYEENADLMSDIFRKALSIQGEFNSCYIGDDAISYKETVTRLKNNGFVSNTKPIYQRMDELSSLIHQYAGNFELVIHE